MNQNYHAYASVNDSGERTGRNEKPAATDYGSTEPHAQERPHSANLRELLVASPEDSIAAVKAPTWRTAITTASGVRGLDIPSPQSGPPAASLSPPAHTRPWHGPPSHDTQCTPSAHSHLRPALSLPVGLTHNVAAGVGADDDTAATGSLVAACSASASASSLPPPLEVYVRGQHTVQGVFHCDRYLAGLDCIWHQGRFVSRSRFEKEAGTSTAKWHCSIKVAQDRVSLGSWLVRHGLPVTKGANRRTPQQRLHEAAVRAGPSSQLQAPVQATASTSAATSATTLGCSRPDRAHSGPVVGTAKPLGPSTASFMPPSPLLGTAVSDIRGPPCAQSPPHPQRRWSATAATMADGSAPATVAPTAPAYTFLPSWHQPPGMRPSAPNTPCSSFHPPPADAAGPAPQGVLRLPQGSEAAAASAAPSSGPRDAVPRGQVQQLEAGEPAAAELSGHLEGPFPAQHVRYGPAGAWFSDAAAVGPGGYGYTAGNPDKGGVASAGTVGLGFPGPWEQQQQHTPFPQPHDQLWQRPPTGIHQENQHQQHATSPRDAYQWDPDTGPGQNHSHAAATGAPPVAALPPPAARRTNSTEEAPPYGRSMHGGWAYSRPPQDAWSCAGAPPAAHPTHGALTAPNANLTSYASGPSAAAPRVLWGLWQPAHHHASGAWQQLPQPQVQRPPPQQQGQCSTPGGQLGTPSFHQEQLQQQQSQSQQHQQQQQQASSASKRQRRRPEAPRSAFARHAAQLHAMQGAGGGGSSGGGWAGGGGGGGIAACACAEGGGSGGGATSGRGGGTCWELDPAAAVGPKGSASPLQLLHQPWLPQQHVCGQEWSAMQGHGRGGLGVPPAPGLASGPSGHWWAAGETLRPASTTAAAAAAGTWVGASAAATHGYAHATELGANALGAVPVAAASEGCGPWTTTRSMGVPLVFPEDVGDEDVVLEDLDGLELLDIMPQVEMLE